MMMHSVKIFEEFFVMHRTVCPIKIGIMNDDHQEDTENVVGPTVIGDVFVTQRKIGLPQQHHRDPIERKDHKGRE